MKSPYAHDAMSTPEDPTPGGPMTGGVFPYATTHGDTVQPSGSLQETFEAIATNTNFGASEFRYWCYGPLGWLRTSKDGVMITDDVNEQPTVYRHLTADEQAILDESFKPKQP